MGKITVTFDSNVWENIVDETKREGDTNYEILYFKITEKNIIPFFFEGLATTETILKKERKDYYKNFKAEITISIDNEIECITEGSKLPELTDYLKKNIPKALDMGFKFIKFSRIGQPSLDINKKYFAEEKSYSLEDRLNRSSICARYIENLGLGKANLENQLGGDNGIIFQTRNDEKVNLKKYAKGIAEWVDGDALSAHYGYGIDYFCTNDIASRAGIYSVFSKNNLENIKNKFDIKVLSPIELIQIIKAME